MLGNTSRSVSRCAADLSITYNLEVWNSIVLPYHLNAATTAFRPLCHDGQNDPFKGQLLFCISAVFEYTIVTMAPKAEELTSVDTLDAPLMLPCGL